MKQEKKSTAQFSARDTLTGIASLLLSFFFLFTETGKNIFIPLENCPHFLQFYYYLISYALIAVGIYFVLRGLKIIKR